MKKLFLSILLYYLFCLPMFGQENESVNSNVFINLCGDASLVSVNYEHLFKLNTKNLLTTQVGVGINREIKGCNGTCPVPPKSNLVIPHHITVIYGSNNRFFEYGLGGSYIYGINEYYLLYPIIGYRIQHFISNKFTFRMFLSIPFTGLETQDIVFIPIGFSFGITL